MKVVDDKLILEDSDKVRVFKVCEHRNPYFINSQFVKACSFKDFKDQYKEHYEYSKEDYFNGYGCKIKYYCMRIGA